MPATPSASTPPASSTPTCIEDGVIDPTKVVRVALENAASVGALLLTTDCCHLREEGTQSSGPGDARRRRHGRHGLLSSARALHRVLANRAARADAQAASPVGVGAGLRPAPCSRTRIAARGALTPRGFISGLLAGTLPRAGFASSQIQPAGAGWPVVTDRPPSVAVMSKSAAANSVHGRSSDSVRVRKDQRMSAGIPPVFSSGRSRTLRPHFSTPRQDSG